VALVAQIFSACHDASAIVCYFLDSKDITFDPRVKTNPDVLFDQWYLPNRVASEYIAFFLFVLDTEILRALEIFEMIFDFFFVLDMFRNVCAMHVL